MIAPYWSCLLILLSLTWEGQLAVHVCICRHNGFCGLETSIGSRPWENDWGLSGVRHWKIKEAGARDSLPGGAAKMGSTVLWFWWNVWEAAHEVLPKDPPHVSTGPLPGRRRSSGAVPEVLQLESDLQGRRKVRENQGCGRIIHRGCCPPVFQKKMKFGQKQESCSNPFGKVRKVLGSPQNRPFL